MSFKWEFSELGVLYLIKSNDNVVGWVKKSVEHYGKYYYVDNINYNINLKYFDTIEECKCALMIRLGICCYKELGRLDDLVVYEF